MKVRNCGWCLMGSKHLLHVLNIRAMDVLVHATTTSHITRSLQATGYVAQSAVSSSAGDDQCCSGCCSLAHFDERIEKLGAAVSSKDENGTGTC
jgi:hypothetical protein